MCRKEIKCHSLKGSTINTMSYKKLENHSKCFRSCDEKRENGDLVTKGIIEGNVAQAGREKTQKITERKAQWLPRAYVAEMLETTKEKEV